MLKLKLRPKLVTTVLALKSQRPKVLDRKWFLEPASRPVAGLGCCAARGVPLLWLAVTHAGVRFCQLLQMARLTFR